MAGVTHTRTVTHNGKVIDVTVDTDRLLPGETLRNTYDTLEVNGESLTILHEFDPPIPIPGEVLDR